MLRLAAARSWNYTLVTVLCLSSLNSFAKCYSVDDPNGVKFLAEVIKDTPYFIKGKVKEYIESEKYTKFKIEVISVLKGKVTTKLLTVSIEKRQEIMSSMPPDKEFHNGQISIFGITKIRKKQAEIITSTCLPELTENQFSMTSKKR